MTGKSDFSEEEWKTVLEGPPSAGVIVAAAARGGTFKESFAMAKAYVEARQQHGQSELLDEIESARPEIDHSRFRSYDELKTAGLQHLRDAVAVLERKATPEEIDAYRRFVMSVAERVASAHREDGVEISGPERAAMDEVAAAIGTT
ncbi:MAG: hypothetical protein JO286_16380 [Solirubrobacterales bacterium]|nr:hypothetical protein [Solirubrobacterales bacterium]MBV9808763.1 hypothetical protein [Solirubrobacterales bacterium]